MDNCEEIISKSEKKENSLSYIKQSEVSKSVGKEHHSSQILNPQNSEVKEQILDLTTNESLKINLIIENENQAIPSSDLEDKSKRLHPRPDSNEELFPSSQKKFKTSILKLPDPNNIAVSTITFDKESPPSKVGELVEEQKRKSVSFKDKELYGLSPLKASNNSNLNYDSNNSKNKENINLEVKLEASEVFSSKSKVLSDNNNLLPEIKKEVEKSNDLKNISAESSKPEKSYEIKIECNIREDVESKGKENIKDENNVESANKVEDDKKLKIIEEDEEEEEEWKSYFKKSEQKPKTSTKSRGRSKSKTPIKSKPSKKTKSKSKAKNAD